MKLVQLGRSPIRKMWRTFRLSINRPLDLQMGHGLPVSRASFLPIFSLQCPSVLDLRSGTGQTDRRTVRETAINAFAPSYGGGA